MTKETEIRRAGLLAVLERVFVSVCLGLVELVNHRSAAEQLLDGLFGWSITAHLTSLKDRSNKVN